MKKLLLIAAMAICGSYVNAQDFVNATACNLEIAPLCLDANCNIVATGSYTYSPKSSVIPLPAMTCGDSYAVAYAVRQADDCADQTPTYVDPNAWPNDDGCFPIPIPHLIPTCPDCPLGQIGQITAHMYGPDLHFF